MKSARDVLIGIVPVDLEVVSAQRGHGSFITFDCRSPNCQTREARVSDFLLWIYLVDWEIYDKEKNLILDCDEIEDAHYKEVLNKFVGAKLGAININEKEFVVYLRFDNHMLIRLEADLDEYDEADEMFMIFNKLKNTVVSFSPKSGIVVEATEPQ